MSYHKANGDLIWEDPILSFPLFWSPKERNGCSTISVVEQVCSATKRFHVEPKS